MDIELEVLGPEILGPEILSWKPHPIATFPRWWAEYADRKNDETDEYVANSLLYDRNHLPRSAPPPDCVRAAPGTASSPTGDLLPEGSPSPMPVATATPTVGGDLSAELPTATAVLPSKRTLDEASV